MMLLFALSAALAAPLPSERVETAQKVGWTGLGISAAGSALVWTGSLAYYDGFIDAANRAVDGTGDPSAADPVVAMRSGLLVSGGLGVSAIGRPVHSFGSALAAQWYRGEGGQLSAGLGWTSVGLWASSTSVFLLSDSKRMDQTWVGLRAASWSAGLGQLIVTQRAINRADPQARSEWNGRPSMEVQVSPTGAAVRGRF